jgi:hypothetical protein
MVGAIDKQKSIIDSGGLMKNGVLPIVFTVVISLLGPSLIVFGQCRSVSGGTWTEPNGAGPERTYNLSQNVSTGAITGTTSRSVCQSSTWPVSGQFQSNGTFSITATNPTPGDLVCVADWFTIQMSLNLPGCELGESISPSIWATLPPDRTKHGWVQILSALNPEINFGGRAIIEEFPMDGTDGCYFDGSIFSRQTRPDPGGWIVGFLDLVPSSTFNIWGRDSEYEYTVQ